MRQEISPGRNACLSYDNFNTACSVKQTPDGGYAIIGSTIYMSTYTSQAILIKLILQEMFRGHGSWIQAFQEHPPGLTCLLRKMD